MCRPTKRPKAVAVQSIAVAADVAAPGDVSKEIDSFVFDLKGDVDFMALNEMWQNEASDEIEPAESPAQSKGDESVETRPKTFVYTAFDMVSDTKNASAIGFSEDGTIIEIRDLEVLAEKILPAYFRHKNVTSFYRQLNSYGFRTTRSCSRDVVHAFSHELFQKDRADMLANIVRKKCLKRQARSAARKEEFAKANDDMPPSSPVSMSSSSDESSAREFAEVKRKPVRESPTPIEALREAQVQAAERACALEEKNRRLREENRSILLESEQIFRSMNSLVDIETGLIERLFGKDASRAFAEQAKPFRMGDEPAIVTKAESLPQNVRSSANEFEAFQGENDGTMFADDELEMLEHIFTSDSIIA